jgi:hypothetical protein
MVGRFNVNSEVETMIFRAWPLAPPLKYPQRLPTNRVGRQIERQNRYNADLRMSVLALLAAATGHAISVGGAIQRLNRFDCR